jgi:hypothetical protein
MLTRMNPLTSTTDISQNLIEPTAGSTSNGIDIRHAVEFSRNEHTPLTWPFGRFSGMSPSYPIRSGAFTPDPLPGNFPTVTTTWTRVKTLRRFHPRKRDATLPQPHLDTKTPAHSPGGAPAPAALVPLVRP